jgi:hypothetical protein
MGYYVTVYAADFSIPKENWDAAFEAVAELNNRDELKNGGGGGQLWFSWMDPDYPAKALAEYEAKKLPHPLVWVFQELGFDWEVWDDDFRLTQYDNKTGAEEHFLEAVAPFVRAGSSLEWRGEDGEMWRDEFDCKTVVTKQGKVVYD